MAEDLGTVLHELAHLAAPDRAHHGAEWRALYAAGAAEALGLPMHTFDDADEQTTLNAHVRDACRAWLVSSGQRTFLRALGVRV